MHMSVLAPPAVATIAVAGSSGYAGRELLRLLAAHPRLRAVACTADTRALAQCDLVLLALPHGASGEVGRELAGARVPVVDLSADLRGEWSYGLPELHRDAIAGAAAVANPGCYATAAILALAPLVAAGVIEPHVVVDGKSGVSGAGKTPSERHLLLPGRRGDRALRAGRPPPPGRDRVRAAAARRRPVTVTFTPHLAPFTRGLLVTAYARLAQPLSRPTPTSCTPSATPASRSSQVVDAVARRRCAAATSATCRCWVDAERGAVVVAAAIDNLVKGAAGQAIQNANLMLGFDETLGLPAGAAVAVGACYPQRLLGRHRRLRHEAQRQGRPRAGRLRPAGHRPPACSPPTGWWRRRSRSAAPRSRPAPPAPSSPTRAAPTPAPARAAGATPGRWSRPPPARWGPAGAGAGRLHRRDRPAAADRRRRRRHRPRRRRRWPATPAARRPTRSAPPTPSPSSRRRRSSIARRPRCASAAWPRAPA